MARRLPRSVVDRLRRQDELPMDEASRLARAQEQGFLPETVYHGTAADIQSFDPAFGGDVTRARSARMGTWFANDPEVAASYARFAAEDVPVRRLLDQADEAGRRGNFDLQERLILQAEQLEQGGSLVGGGGQNVIPARVRGNLLEVDARGATMADLDDGQLFRWAQEAREQGRDGLRIRNFSDNADYGQYLPADHFLIFDPSNIRSTNAAFDPAQSGSRNLLAGIGGGAVGLGLMASPDEAEAAASAPAPPRPQAEMRAYDPTLRERTQDLISRGLQRTGMSPYEANRNAYGFTGSRAPDAQMLGMGLLDFTPAGLVFGMQEGGRAIERGRNMGGVDGAIEGGLGLLEVGLSAIPAGLATRPLIRRGREAVQRRRSR